MCGNALYTRKGRNNMWIVYQNKKSVLGFSSGEILLKNKSIRIWDDKIAIYDTPERTAEVFEELLTSLAKGDQMFRMPEK
jgi:hypothetical protein